MNMMLDLETLSTNHDAPVVSIGAVFFNEYGIKETFYRVLDLNEQTKNGRRPIDPQTMMWWMSQPKDVQRVFKEETIPVLEALNQLSTFFNTYEKVKIWARPVTFDVTVMENLYRDFGLTEPWTYRDPRDMKTFLKYNAQKGHRRPKMEGVAHNALDDAVSQAKEVISVLNSNK